MRNFLYLLMISYFMVSCDPKDPSANADAVQEINLQVLPKVNGLEAKVNQFYHLKIIANCKMCEDDYRRFPPRHDKCIAD